MQSVINYAMTLSFVFPMSFLHAQIVAPSLQLNFGSKQSAVAATYGKPFEHWKLTTSEYSAQVGVPTGLWDVYHLTTPQDRMYVTMLHFGSGSNREQEKADLLLNSLMLMPNGHWSVTQILDDQPELRSLCANNCDVVRISNRTGNISLLLKPKAARADGMVLYFEGDSATITWKSVSSLESAVSWVYALRLEDFDSHHADCRREVIRTWRPEINIHK